MGLVSPGGFSAERAAASANGPSPDDSSETSPTPAEKVPLQDELARRTVGMGETLVPWRACGAHDIGPDRNGPMTLRRQER